jgi:Superinfection immunity protein
MKNVLRIVFGILFVVTLYLLPTGVAMLRRTRNAGSIAILNVFLGWTLVAYVISLAMAFRTRDVRSS